MTGLPAPSPHFKGQREGSVNPFVCAAFAHTSSVRHTLPKFRGRISSGFATRAASRPWAGTTLVAFTYGPLRTPDLDDDGGHDVTLPALPWACWDLGARHARDGLDAIRHREVPIRGEISPDSSFPTSCYATDERDNSTRGSWPTAAHPFPAPGLSPMGTLRNPVTHTSRWWLELATWRTVTT